MTIVKLKNDKLWVHSPTKLSPEVKQEVEELGEVAYIVGPSNGHNIWLSQWQEEFPEAELHVSDGIPDRVKISGYKIIDDASAKFWEEDLQRKSMPDVPFLNESVFFHDKTKSLIVTDLIQNHDDHVPKALSTRMATKHFSFLGFKGTCVAPPLKMGFVRKDHEKFSAFIDEIKEWDFERIVVSHGDIIEKDAKKIFSELCWLL